MKVSSILLSAILIINITSCQGKPNAGIIGKLYSGSDAFGGNVYYYLLPSGKVIKGCPRGGLESFDFAAACTAMPSSCGSYTKTGTTFNINWSDNRKQTGKVQANGDIDIDGSLIGEMQKVPSSLSASYDFGVITSTISVAEKTKFNADGTFQVSKVGGVTSTDGKQGAEFASGGKGKYKINGYTITMTDDKGKITTHTIYTMGKSVANPDYIGWDGNFLSKVI